jgi:hypothetical protein
LILSARIFDSSVERGIPRSPAAPDRPATRPPVSSGAREGDHRRRPATEAFLVIPPDHRNTVRVRLVMDAVTALFERERALLAGCV